MAYESVGHLNGISLDINTGKPILTITVDHRDTKAFSELAKQDRLDIIIKKHRKSRSLDANAYYWVLVNRLAKVHGLSIAECHNILLQKYGQFERVNDRLVTVLLPDTGQTEQEVRNSITFHVRPTSKVIDGDDGRPYRMYVMMRGSHTYNTEEMARLISGLIDDCRQSGIPDHEIMTPFEKKQLREKYGIGGNDEIQENQSL